MIKFEVGQRFWDDRNCCEIEIMDFNCTNYFCRVQERDTIVCYHWFAVREIARYRRL